MIYKAKESLCINGKCARAGDSIDLSDTEAKVLGSSVEKPKAKEKDDGDKLSGKDNKDAAEL
jgi:hypothetical protein